MFRQYAGEAQRQRRAAGRRLDMFFALDRAAILDRVERSGVQWPGALPTAELDQAVRLCLPFGRQWANHHEARAWAREVLHNQAVLAVDGSQLVPTKDHSVPVGAIQIGWYINYHLPGGAYQKDIEFQVLAPQELLGDLEGAEVEAEPETESGGFPAWRINQARFVRECQKLCELMQDLRRTGHESPVSLLDGSFIVSFAGQMRPERARPYVAAVEELLACSEQHETPLAAFVDRSYSRDFATLLNLLAAGSEPLNLSDSTLVAGLLAAWGDRTPFFYCAREDALSREGRGHFYRDVVFCYLRLTADRAPARLEMPAWVLEHGLAERVVDVVRAQCVVGSGYPYAIETADAVAVIGHQDRQRFYALFEQFLASEGIPFVQTRKAASKESRR